MTRNLFDMTLANAQRIKNVPGRKTDIFDAEQGYVEEHEILDCVKGTVKNKVKALSESLFGTITHHQMFMIRQSWNPIAFFR